MNPKALCANPNGFPVLPAAEEYKSPYYKKTGSGSDKPSQNKDPEDYWKGTEHDSKTPKSKHDSKTPKKPKHDETPKPEDTTEEYDGYDKEQLYKKNDPKENEVFPPLPSSDPPAVDYYPKPSDGFPELPGTYPPAGNYNPPGPAYPPGDEYYSHDDFPKRKHRRRG